MAGIGYNRERGVFGSQPFGKEPISRVEDVTDVVDDEEVGVVPGLGIKLVVE